MNALELCQYGKEQRGSSHLYTTETVMSNLKHGLPYKLIKALFVLSRKNKDWGV